LGYVRLEEPEGETTYSEIDSVDAVIDLLTGEADPVTSELIATWTTAFRDRLKQLAP
jgi:hypothetical protein